MKIKYNNEIIAGSLFAIISCVLWFLIPSQIQTMEKSLVNAQTVPSIAIGGIFLFATGLLLQGLFSVQKKELTITKQFFKSDDFVKMRKSVLFTFILLIYLVFITFIGYVISTIFLVCSILGFYKSKKWYYYVIASVTVLIVYYVFANILNVSLP